jgi:hypothetical protein
MSIDLESLYYHRFAGIDNRPVWKEITRFFNKTGRVSEHESVCDIACGDGEFLNQIECKTKYGVDLRRSPALSNEVIFLQKNVLDLCLDDFPGEAPSQFFISNFLEHLESKDQISQLLRGIARILDSAGSRRKRILIMGPNIDYVGTRYWDFFDHNLPLNANSVGEALASEGFTVTESIGRFLPFSTKSRLPKDPRLVRAYLAFPPAWRVLGGQFLITGER